MVSGTGSARGALRCALQRMALAHVAPILKRMTAEEMVSCATGPEALQPNARASAPTARAGFGTLGDRVVMPSKDATTAVGN